MTRLRPTWHLAALVTLAQACGSPEPASVPDGGAPALTPVAPVARRVLRPDDFPTDRPYSYGVRVGDAVFLAGQLGRHPATGVVEEGIEAQTRQAMENIGAILATDGLGHQHLVKCHVFLGSMDDYAGMNRTYGSFFSERVPARTTVEAAGVPGGSRVEITCIAHADLAAIGVVRPPEGALPAPLGPYSPAVWAGDTLFVSGMGGQDPLDRTVAADVPGQVTQTLANIRTTLEAADLSFGDVVAAAAYVTAPDEMDGFDAAFRAAFAEGQTPAVSRVFLPRLPGGIKAELTFVAARGASRPSRVYAPLASAPDAGDVTAQAAAALATLRQEVEGRGLTWSDVVDVRVFLADLADMSAMDAVYRETFPTDPPARTTVQAHLQGGARVQIGVIATR